MKIVWSMASFSTVRRYAQYTHLRLLSDNLKVRGSGVANSLSQMGAVSIVKSQVHDITLEIVTGGLLLHNIISRVMNKTLRVPTT